MGGIRAAKCDHVWGWSQGSQSSWCWSLHQAELWDSATSNLLGRSRPPQPSQWEWGSLKTSQSQDSTSLWPLSPKRMRLTYSWHNILEKFSQPQHVWMTQDWSLADPHQHNSPWSSACPSAALGPKHEESSSDPQTTQKNGEKVEYLYLLWLQPTWDQQLSKQFLKYSSASTQTKDYIVLTGRSGSQLHFSCIWCEEHSNVRAHEYLACPWAERSPVHTINWIYINFPFLRIWVGAM